MPLAVCQILYVFVFAYAPFLWAYPLDGTVHTGMGRLDGYRLRQEGKVPGSRLPAGALLQTEQVDLRLLAHQDMSIPAPDPEFSAALRELLGQQADDYALAVLDLTDPGRPRYGAHQDTLALNPGSVGKLLVALGCFQALADIYPKDLAGRQEVLRKTMVTADAFIRTDVHRVPLWNPATMTLRHRRLQEGDRANLWTYLDWMLSASSNAATSMVMREILLMARFGSQYPVDETTIQRFFQTTKKSTLSTLLARGIHAPVSRNGLRLEALRQGGFFTREGKKRVPGTTSRATPKALIHFLVRLEQGRLVDRFSSTAIKRLLYLTQRRIRYASSPALSDAAVYFKSGSLYRCKPEPGFECGDYQGNVVNMLNSVAIIEYPAAQPRLFYMVAVMSNVLRKNAAVMHQTLATRIHRLMETVHASGTPPGIEPNRVDKPSHPAQQ